MIVGVAAVAAFLITGQLMRHHTPPMSTLTDSVRLIYRSRHIYILAGGLVNLMLGLYWRRQSRGWRRPVQTAGSALLLLAPALLVVAFAVEPAGGFHEETPWSHAGLYALFAGSMAHLAVSSNSTGQQQRER
jgi:peptidoglycan/LPS O-acetylase OafA/YrhL